jgi:hypothetical protein
LDLTASASVGGARGLHHGTYVAVAGLFESGLEILRAFPYGKRGCETGFWGELIRGTEKVAEAVPAYGVNLTARIEPYAYPLVLAACFLAPTGAKVDLGYGVYLDTPSLARIA